MEQPSQHRMTVIKRLLDAGVSPATLASVLPEFRDVIVDATTVESPRRERPLAAAS